MKNTVKSLIFVSLCQAPCVALELIDEYSGENDELTSDSTWWQDLQERELAGASINELSDRVLLRMATTDDAVCDVQSTGVAGAHVISIRRGYFNQMVVDGSSRAVNQALARQLQPQQGRIIRKSELSSMLAWLHRNPFHAVAPTFTPGTADGAVDSLWHVEPLRRWRATIGANNQGIAPLSRERFLLEAMLGDLAGHNSVMSLQWVTAADPNEFSSLRWDNTMYLPWRHEWRTSFSWTGTSFLDDCSCVIPQLVEGETWQASTKYVIPSENRFGWSSEKHVAIYYRSTNNALEAGDTTNSGVVDSIFLGMGWNWLKKRARSESRVSCEFLVSPGGIGGNNDQADHEVYRIGAENNYVMLRTSLQHVQALQGNWRWAGYATSQISSAPVLPHDQMALGGMQGVRALPENALLGDQVIRYGTELRSETWKVKTVPCELAVSAYLDGGYARDMEEHSQQTAHSLGFGLHLVSANQLRIDLSQAWEFRGENMFYGSMRWSF